MLQIINFSFKCTTYPTRTNEARCTYICTNKRNKNHNLYFFEGLTNFETSMRHKDTQSIRIQHQLVASKCVISSGSPTPVDVILWTRCYGNL